jgi:protein-S-isoprenylcysteine O-methyltransferase Ste14
MIVADMHRHTPTPTLMMILYKASLLFTCTFFAFGALGDVHKSISKARLGSHHLVTGGIYKYIRHPNYTGEMMGWIISAISPLWIILASGKSVFSLSLWRKIFIPLLLGFIGALGMAFILSAATCSLEVRQKETYGGMDSYHLWVQRSWTGVSFKPKFKS